MPKEVQLTASYSQFSTYFSGNSNWTHFNISYFPQGLFKGLCLRDQVEVDNGGVQGLLSGNPRQVASHLILEKAVTVRQGLGKPRVAPMVFG